MAVTVRIDRCAAILRVMMAPHVVAHLVGQGKVADRARSSRDGEPVAWISGCRTDQITNSTNTAHLADFGDQIGFMRIAQLLYRRIAAKVAQIGTSVSALGINKLLRVHHTNPHTDSAVEICRIRHVDCCLRMRLRLGVTAQHVLGCGGVHDHHIDAITGIDRLPQTGYLRLRRYLIGPDLTATLRK